MQRIYSISLSPEQYNTQESHRQIVPETTCPACSRCDSLHRHGTYWRWVTCSLGQAISITVARFLCLACRCTVSYLPSFALSYRLVNAQTVDAFLQGELQREDVQRNQELLQTYKRRMLAFAPVLIATVGAGLGMAPPERSPVWGWIKKACGSLTAATRQLVIGFRITLFDRYQCHQIPSIQC
jgi:hypothetical protein